MIPPLSTESSPFGDLNHRPWLLRLGKDPRLAVRCKYPDTDLPPTEVTFRLSPSYGLLTGHEGNEWFIDMMYEYEEFEVETDRTGEQPLSFWSETVRGVMVE